MWLPIFAGSLGFAALQARDDRRDSELMRAVGWPLAGAFAGTAVWAPLVRTKRYWRAQAALTAIAGCAETARRHVARVQEPDEGRADLALTTVTAGMLAAWGVTASGVNLASMLAGQGLLPVGRRRTGAAVAMLLGLGVAGAAATSSTGAAPVSEVYAATLIWSLVGVVAGQRTTSPAAATAAASAMVPIVVAAMRKPPV